MTKFNSKNKILFTLLFKNKADLTTVLELKLCYKKVISKGKTARLSTNFAEFLPSELWKTRNSKVICK